MEEKPKKQQYVELGKMFYQIATYSFTGIVFAVLFKTQELNNGPLGYFGTIITGGIFFTVATMIGMMIEYNNKDKEK